MPHRSLAGLVDKKVVALEGYTLISRRDRRDGDDFRNCGGAAVSALTQHADSITEMHKSITCERVWVIVHSDLGPLLLGVWYRPPVQGETDSISSLREEWNELGLEAVGTIVVGDMNVHHRKSLKKIKSK